MIRESSRERWTRVAIQVWAIIGILILLGVAAWFIGRVFTALVPFLMGLLIVLLLRRPVDMLVERGLNRVIAVALCYFTAVSAIAILLTFIIPPIYEQITLFVSAVPGYARKVYSLWDTLVVNPRGAQRIPEWLQTAATSLRDQVVAGAGRSSAALAQTAVAAGGSIASGVIAFILALIIGFYTLVDLPRLREEIVLLAGPSSREEIVHVFETVSRVLGGWLRGTLIESTAVATLMTIGLYLFHVPYALAIGVIGGVFNVVPYVGPALTAVLAAAAGFFVGPTTALWAAVVIIAVQQIDSLLLAPRIMSEQVDLHPLMVILALLIGVSLFGVPGMVLSVPIAAILKGLFVYWFEKRHDRQITTDDGVLFRTPKEAREDTPAPEADAADADAVVPGDAGGDEPGT